MPNKVKKFYTTQTIYSKIKSDIVVNYFCAWAKLIGKHADELNYVDLFSGPGIYDDGNPSTPVLITERVLANNSWSHKLSMRFNDIKKRNIKELKKKIKSLVNSDMLKKKPTFSSQNAKILEEEFAKGLSPTFSFIDPFGYAGLTQKLIKNLTKDWGSDCIFFFNYSRVRWALEFDNEKIKGHMNSLFGEQNAEFIIEEINKIPESYDRQQFLLKQLFDYLRSFNLKYLVPFTFRRERKNEVHMIIFGSKDFRAYEIIKDIMWKESDEKSNCYASFRYSKTEQYNLLSEKPQKKIADKMCVDFIGKSDAFQEIYKDSASIFGYFHYSKKCYKEALLELEKQGKVKINYVKEGLFVNTHITDETIITFLDNGNGD